jgi:hypothetical protein
MKPFRPPEPILDKASYAACRHGGAPPGFVRVQLALPPETAARLELLFRAQPGGAGADAMRPRFARHGAHVAAVMAHGGYPAIGERPGR